MAMTLIYAMQMGNQDLLPQQSQAAIGGSYTNGSMHAELKQTCMKLCKQKQAPLQLSG